MRRDGYLTDCFAVIAGWNMKLIIGAGFLGSALAASLAAKEKVRVVNKEASPLCGQHNIDFIEGDLKNLDWESALRAVDVVYPMHGTIISYDGTDGIVRDINEGIIPMLTLVSECKKRGIRRIIYPSSGGTVYGKYSVHSRETHPTVPYSVYAAHKIALENYFKLFNLYDDMEIITLRIANPYGYLETANRKQGIIPIFIDRIINGQPIEVWGAGKNVRDYIYIDDLVDALEKAAAYRGEYRCFNIGSSTGTSIKKVIRLIEQHSGKKAQVTVKPGRICDAESSYLSNDLAVKELGWKPSVTLDEGIQRLIARYGA